MNLSGAVPERFWNVPYAASRTPGAALDPMLGDGANCQSFAYAVLRHFGRFIPDFRSRELWHDREYTIAVTDREPLDLVLFNRACEPFGAHIGVCFEDGILHLSKSVGWPALWDVAQFVARPQYRVLIGAKRTRR